MLIIGLAGPQFSGKTLVANHLRDRYGAWIFDSRWIWQEVARRGLPRERASCSQVTDELRQQRGSGFVAERMLQELPNPRPSLAAHDGLRWVGGVEVHRQATPFRLIFLESALECRFARARGKIRPGRRTIETMEQFMEDESLESELEIPLLRPLADQVLASENRQWLLAAVDRLITLWLEQENLPVSVRP